MDVSRNNIEFQPPVLWELDQDHKPKNPVQLIAAITVLRDQPQWVRDHEADTRKIISLLVQTDHLSEEALAIQNVLIKNFPALFSELITLKIGDVQRQIPIDRLIARSEKFKVALSSGLKESQTCEISLTDPENIKNEVLETFLSYLAGGDVVLTGDNAIDLMRLAQDHDLPILLDDCAKFIGENLDVDSFKNVLLAACAYNLRDLKWQCIVFASKYEAASQTFVGDEVSAEVLKILQLSYQCKHFNMMPNFSDEGKKSVQITKSDGLITLKYLNRMVGIQDLRIKNSDEEDLQKISELLPNLYSVNLVGGIATKLPDVWLKNLKMIFASDCYNLASLDAKAAEIIILYNCSNIEMVNAPLLKSIHCSLCPCLASVVALELEEIKYVSCALLATFDFRKAKRITLSDCKIDTIDAPNAIYINCARGIKSVYAPVVEEISISFAILTELNLPKARMVGFNGCFGLRSINAPEAKGLSCRDNIHTLRSLTVSKGCVINAALPRDCLVTYVISHEALKRNFKTLIDELIEKHSDRHQVLIMELSRNIASFSIKNNEIPLMDLIEMTTEVLKAKMISVPTNFAVMVADDITMANKVLPDGQ